MWIKLPNLRIIILNVLGIPAAHLLLSWCCTRMPSAFFDKAHKTPASAPSPIYEKLFLFRQWKHLLPDAAPWMKGFSKGSLQSIQPDYLLEFIRDTRRGEFSDWLQLLVITGFIAWNPTPANYIIILYAIVSNLPCILNLRYTRQRMCQLFDKQHASH